MHQRRHSGVVGAEGRHVRLAAGNRAGGRLRADHEQVRAAGRFRSAGSRFLPRREPALPVPAALLQSGQARGRRGGIHTNTRTRTHFNG